MQPDFDRVIREVARPSFRLTVLQPSSPGQARVRHPPLVPPSRHEIYELVICYDGEMIIVGAERIHVLHRGDAMLIPPGAWHYESYHSTRQAYRVCWLIAEGLLMSCNFAGYRGGRFTLRHGARLMLDESSNPLADLGHEIGEKRAHWRLKSRLLLTDLLVDLRRSAGGPIPAPVKGGVDSVHKALRAIESRFREPIQIKSLAREVGLSPNYLSHRIRRVNGMTFKSYLNSIRIHHAHLLLRSGCSLKDTADRCGFQDVYYFSRIFRRKCGMPPGRFARSASR